MVGWPSLTRLGNTRPSSFFFPGSATDLGCHQHPTSHHRPHHAPPAASTTDPPAVATENRRPSQLLPQERPDLDAMKPHRPSRAAHLRHLAVRATTPHRPASPPRHHPPDTATGSTGRTSEPLLKGSQIWAWSSPRSMRLTQTTVARATAPLTPPPSATTAGARPRPHASPRRQWSVPAPRHPSERRRASPPARDFPGNALRRRRGEEEEGRGTAAVAARVPPGSPTGATREGSSFQSDCQLKTMLKSSFQSDCQPTCRCPAPPSCRAAARPWRSCRCRPGRTPRTHD